MVYSLDWITDPHLDHLRDASMLLDFVRKLHERSSQGLLLTGDIGESATVCDFLEILCGAYQRPIYFVLGNHDYYGGWRQETAERVRELCSNLPAGALNWMTDKNAPVMLENKTAIVGHDGIYDGRAGVPGTRFSLTDFFLPNGVKDFVQALSSGSRHLFSALRELSEESADHIRSQVFKAKRKGARRIIILTHVPPFLEASLFRGKPSSPETAPFYVNQTLGETLAELAEIHPKIQFEVFAGHTHGPCEYVARENLTVRVGKARYGRLPVFQTPVEV